MILAFNGDGEVIGALATDLYEGCDEPYPHGWKELLDAGLTFDQVDCDPVNEEQEAAILKNYDPRKRVAKSSPPLFGWATLLNKKVVAYRGVRPTESWKRPNLSYILFDDGKSYVELREHDRYDYHDFCEAARMLEVNTDEKTWRQMMNCEDPYCEAETTP